jgi:hypothetical protein
VSACVLTRCCRVEGDLALPAARTAADTPAMTGERTSQRASPADSEAIAGGVPEANKRKKDAGRKVHPSAKKMKQRDAADKLEQHFTGLKQALEASKTPDVGLDKVRVWRGHMYCMHALHLLRGSPGGEIFVNRLTPCTTVLIWCCLLQVVSAMDKATDRVVSMQTGPAVMQVLAQMQAARQAAEDAKTQQRADETKQRAEETKQQAEARRIETAKAIVANMDTYPPELVDRAKAYLLNLFD